MEDLKDTIYVYTPKGDVIELPYGSTPIDFAYRVHSKVGDSMVGAIVNEQIVPLDYVLQDNDVIKINTNKTSTPSKNWLEIAYTNQAKNKIRSYFNKIDKAEYLKKGEELLTKEFRKKKISVSETLSGDNLKKILDDLHLANINDLYINVGSGKISVSHVINSEDDTKEETILNKVIKDNVDSEYKGDIIVEGIDDIKVNRAKCCTPVKDDDIVGYIQTGIGINIHRSICPNISNIKERLISVRWNDKTDKKYSTNIMVYTDGMKDLIFDIASVTQSNGLTLKRINNIKMDGKYSFEIKVSVPDKEVLDKYMNALSTIEDVTGVERIIK